VRFQPDAVAVEVERVGASQPNRKHGVRNLTAERLHYIITERRRTRLARDMKKTAHGV
jgi:hypothetical protein